MTPVDAAQPDRVATQRVAARLAAIIRRDAHQQAKRSRGSVTVVKRCCGVRVLRVHYRVKPTGTIHVGAYVLRLETKHGVVEGVAVFQYAAEVGVRIGTERWRRSWKYAFTIHHESADRSRGWTFSVSYEDVSELEASSPGPVQGLGSSRECRLPGPVPIAVYRKVLEMLVSAKHPSALRYGGACVIPGQSG
jgi:hypothetical protein